MSKTVADALRSALSLIDTPETCGRKHFATDFNGVCVAIEDPSCKMLCSMGAVYRTASRSESVGGERLRDLMLYALARATDGRPVPVYHDALSHEAIMAWWQRAIAQEEGTS